MFRYERPQKGRLRQFHQIGIELLGAPEPGADVEMIAVGGRHPGAPRHPRSHACSSSTRWAIGESRTAYREALVDYFAATSRELSEDSRERLERNPLRILDSKDEGDSDRSPRRRASPTI